jgi:MFS transporter, OFA family, oxalate/formate antiporter
VQEQSERSQTSNASGQPGTTWRASLAQRLPFYYGWVVFTIVASTSYAARPLMSVAVLSVFVVPMTQEFGWSRGLFSGAVSVGGLCGVLISPIIGRLLDRYGSRVIVSATAAVAGICAIGLTYVRQTWAFYTLYVPGRMSFASPMELAISTSISNWFIRRRALALAIYGITQGTGLAVMPMLAQLLITHWGWRSTWTILGVYTLILGVIPSLLFMARRPEDLGLEPDPVHSRRSQLHVTPAQRAHGPAARKSASANRERHFTLRQALVTRAFWVLAAFSAVGFMTQAGVNLHQVSHYIHEGLPGTVATIMVSTFALAQVPAGLLWSTLTRRMPVRYVLALAGLSVAFGAVGTALSSQLVGGIIAASLLGSGVGGLHLLLRLVWADYYGRQHLGSIQGFTLPVQIGGQAMGPIIAGFVFDATGSYHHAFVFFAILVTLGSLLVLTAVPPPRHQDQR